MPHGTVKKKAHSSSLGSSNARHRSREELLLSILLLYSGTYIFKGTPPIVNKNTKMYMYTDVHLLLQPFTALFEAGFKQFLNKQTWNYNMITKF